MAIDFDALDYDDPCALLAALRPARMRLIAGSAVTEVRQSDGRMMKLEKGDLDALGRLVAQLEDECRVKQGLRRQRHAATAGSLPRRS